MKRGSTVLGCRHALIRRISTNCWYYICAMQAAPYATIVSKGQSMKFAHYRREQILQQFDQVPSVTGKLIPRVLDSNQYNRIESRNGKFFSQGPDGFLLWHEAIADTIQFVIFSLNSVASATRSYVGKFFCCHPHVNPVHDFPIFINKSPAS